MQTRAQLRLELIERPLCPNTPALVVFDKDGTLIDFNFMWARWITELARRLDDASKYPVSALLFRTLGYDAACERAIPSSPLAVCSMKTLRDMTADILWRAGLSRQDAQRVTDAVWFVPDPVAWARPLGDLQALFSKLCARGIRISVATSDDRAPTQATLHALGIAHLTDALVCADDGLPNKPAPDMLLHICRMLDIPPAQSVMVGDAVADLEMARAARVGFTIGVASGLTSAAELGAHADLVIDSVADLCEIECVRREGQLFT